MSAFLYAYERRTLTAELLRRMQAMDMRCYQKILRISHTDHVTNVEVRSRIRPGKDLFAMHCEGIKKKGKTKGAVG